MSYDISKVFLLSAVLVLFTCKGIKFEPERDIDEESLGYKISDPAVYTPVEPACYDTFNAVAVGAGVDLPDLVNNSINEASGLAQSRSGDDLFWINNDSGDINRIYAVSSSGADLGQLILSGATAVDYEDIATGPGPDPAKHYIYVADVGDNGSTRSDCKIYRVEEPDITGISTPFDLSAPAAVFPFTYPDGAHNCETLMIDPQTWDFYLVDKTSGAVPTVYRGTTTAAGVPQVLVKLADLHYFSNIGTAPDPLYFPDGMIAGDISPTGSEILIRTHRRVFYWHRQPGETIIDAMVNRDPLIFNGAWQEPVGENICFATDNTGFYSLSEEAGGYVAHLRFYERLCP